MHRRMIFCLIPLFLILLVFSCTRKPVTPSTKTPVINAIEASPYIVSKEGTVYLNLAVTDPDEDKMYFEWSCPEGQFFADDSLYTPSNITNPCWWKAPAAEGNYTISVTCTDSIGDDPEFVDTFLTVSVSIYSLDSIIGELKFSSPFSMYIDDDGNLFVTDPGLSAVHFHNGTRWFSWNFMGLDTSIDTTTIYDTTFEIDSTDTTILFIDTTEIVETLVGKGLYDSPSAISVDEDRNFFYVANVEIDSTKISVHDLDKMFTPEDTVTALSTIVTMSTDSGSGVWDTLTDTLSLETLCLYGFQFKMNDRTDLNFRIIAPYSFVIDPVSKWFYISTRISIISYDTTWAPNGWIKNWSTSTATGGINFEGKGMKLFNDNLYLASFGTDAGHAYSVVRRFMDIANPNGPTADDANFWISDSFTAYPNGIAIAQNGHIFLTEGGGSLFSFHRVVEYDENGNFIRTFGSIGEKEDQFNCPSDIFIDSSGKIYVVDMGNHCIKVFSE
ncbi:hypothetical protein KAX75_08605 [candidate division WOR-3 bacterium]|nr:hypothetical protein [candidate division WOR-3 bacterium]